MLYTVLYISLQVSTFHHFQFSQAFQAFVCMSTCSARDVLSWRRFDLRTLKRGNFFEAYLIIKLRNFISKKGK